MPGADEDPRFFATGISLIAHMRSPARAGGAHEHPLHRHHQGWFGGGADLTPMLDAQRSQEADDAGLPRRAASAPATRHDPRLATPRFKAWCDEYFFLPHRNEPRGVGGIFYDYHDTGDFDARLRLHPRRRRGVPGGLSEDRARAAWTSPGPTAERERAAGAPRPLRRVQPALRPRHDVRPEDRRQRRGDPDVAAARR